MQPMKRKQTRRGFLRSRAFRDLRDFVLILAGVSLPFLIAYLWVTGLSYIIKLVP